MTTAVQVLRAPHTGNGATTVFGFSFSATKDSDVVVYLSLNGAPDVVVPAEDYALVRNLNDGTVTYNPSGTPLTSLDKLAIVRETPYNNSFSFKPQERVTTTEIEDSDDNGSRQVQQLDERIDRCVQIEPTSTTDPATLVAEIEQAAVDTAADAVATAADVVTTNADVVSTTNSAAAAASSAAEGLYQNVVSKDFSDSPLAPLLAEEGTLYRIDTSGGNVVINLSALSVYAEDMKFAFVKVTGDANTVTINRGGTDTIEGGTSVVIANQYETNVLIGDVDTGTWINSIQATSILNNSVDVTKLAREGTADQVLHSNGPGSDVSYKTIPYGWELVETKDITSPVATVTFDSGITANTMHEFVFESVEADTVGRHVEVQFKASSVAQNVGYAQQTFNTVGAVGYIGNGNLSQARLLNGLSAGVCGKLLLSTADETNDYFGGSWLLNAKGAATGSFAATVNTGVFGSTVKNITLDEVTFYTTTGTFDSGRIHHLRLKA